LFIRPQEWVPIVYGQPVLKWVIGAAVVTWLGSLMHSNWRLRDAPQNWLMLGLFFAVLMSHIAHTYLGGAIEAFLDFGKVVLLYFLIVSLVTSVKRAKGLLLAMVVGCLFMAAWGIWQAHSPDHYGFAVYGDNPSYYQAVIQQPDIPGGQPEIVRVRALGIFRDPNDLSLMLVAVLPFLFGTALSSAASTMVRVLSLAAAAPMLYCVYLTNSRGGWLALGVMLVAFLYTHIPSRKVGLALAGAACVAVLALGPSRMATISSEEGSARGRLIAWGEGNRMLKQWPLFGAGQGRFMEFSDSRRVAHNSFVHCWAELGLFGYFFWLGMVVATLKDAWALSKVQSEDQGAAELGRLGKAGFAGFIGFMAATLFLSRAYVVPPYILFALLAALRVLYEKNCGPLASSFMPRHWKYVLAAELMSIPALYLALRLIQ
jgi:hypothetical protein